MDISSEDEDYLIYGKLVEFYLLIALIDNFFIYELRISHQDHLLMIIINLVLFTKIEYRQEQSMNRVYHNVLVDIINFYHLRQYVMKKHLLYENTKNLIQIISKKWFIHFP